MPEISQTPRAAELLNATYICCTKYRHEFVMPEHLLHSFLNDDVFLATLEFYNNEHNLLAMVEEHLESVEKIPEEIDYEPEISVQMDKLLHRAFDQVQHSSANALDLPHLVLAMFGLKESWASYLLKKYIGEFQTSFLTDIVSACEEDITDIDIPEEGNDGQPSLNWRGLVLCMNDHYEKQNPLIGRENELHRTIQVLCRRDKNNPLHVGDPGVGKTALVWGLVRRIAEQQVPDRLKNSRVYQVDVGSLLAGTQYRGDFEKRIKTIMEGIIKESDSNIVYIDEIHTLVGAGLTSDSAMDASNMLKPYLESSSIRFIGSTTHEEYNRYFSKSKGLVRRFQQIDILEPSVDEAKHIIRQLQPRYEEFHGVTYEDEAIDYAVEASAKYINERRLPDKAIDIIDEAGAAMEISAENTPIGKKEISDILSKICKVDTLAQSDESDFAQLETLTARIQSQIYGQDEAIKRVTEAVQMSRAGLLDDNKPLASLLFVGPTGVGKTEVARTLARELGVELLRFDMSEYAEKHTVAKLIGSPAGYVGYEDGGLLTDAVRKTPHCVLLLDEIEKAHSDIYNILLQVMDYARLTDNKGRQADFRNAVVIMTSNAGAQYASQASIGYNSTVSRGSAMMKQVKQTFKPEFLNRLSGTVIFNDMDSTMAKLILNKKLRELESKLQAKNVTLTLSEDALGHLLKEGFIPEYGAREMDRVISQQLKPLLMREILFGSLKQGGNIKITLSDGSLSIG